MASNPNFQCIREKEREREMPESFFTEVDIPQQKAYGEILFPRVLSPNLSSNKFSAFTKSVKAHKSWLESLLYQSGAVLFRGFPVSSPSDFNAIIEAFGFDEFHYLHGAALRTNVVGRVYTANESPPDLKIPFHHELSQHPEFPSKLIFFCEVAPGSGGETPLVPSHIVYEKMKEKHPEFVKQMEEHGLIYTRVLGEEDDLSSPVGLGWKSKFLTHDKNIAEERAAKLRMKLEWMEDGVKTILGPLPAIKFDEARNRKIWFNNLLTVKDTKFGDGKPLPEGIVLDCSKILDEECVAIPWQKGDILLVDNLAVLHARKPLIKPPRSILASLCK